MLGVVFAQLAMALLKSQGGFREVEAMLTSAPLRGNKEQEKKEKESGAPPADSLKRQTPRCQPAA